MPKIFLKKISEKFLKSCPKSAPIQFSNLSRPKRDPPLARTHRPLCGSLIEQRSVSSADHAPVSLPSGVRTRIVLDTSVLVADPSSLHSFPGCEVVIPLTVVEELDGLKTRMDDVGRAARTALRTIEDLRRRAGGSIHHPVPLSSDPAHRSRTA